MSTLFRYLLPGLLLASALAHADMRVVQLQHRTDSEMISLLQPLLNPGERLAGNGQQLVLRADSTRLDELEQLIASLDTPLRRVLIILDDSGSGISGGRGINVQGRIRSRHGDILLGESGQQDNQVSIRHYRSHDLDSGQRSVQTLEGNAAFIMTGQQLPQQQWRRDHHGRPVLETVHRQLSQGFYVTPSIQGNRVTLELSTQNDRLARHDARMIEHNSLSTRISGPLGEWIDIGGLEQSSRHDNSAILSGSQTYSSENKRLRIKVELLDE